MKFLLMDTKDNIGGGLAEQKVWPGMDLMARTLFTVNN